jgi:hypothetical protein
LVPQDSIKKIAYPWDNMEDFPFLHTFLLMPLLFLPTPTGIVALVSNF